MSTADSWKLTTFSQIKEKFNVKGSEEPSAIVITSGNPMELEKRQENQFLC